MEKIDILRKYNDSFKLNRVVQNILDWSLVPVSGKGVYRGHDRFACIELKIYKAPDNSFNSSILWEVSQTQIPDDPEIKAAVEKSASFFIDLLAVLKGEEINIVFEITGGDFHIVDTKARFYSNAVFLAIIDCFEKK